MRKEKKPLHWVKLDNAAKIYPAVRQKSWSNLFRQSVTLREEVDVAVLEKALEVVVKRFPSIAARLRKGAFWYYLQQVAEPPKIREEYSYPLVPMGKEEMRKCAFRVIVYKERIAVEFFHALTDGSGAMVFLKNLVAEYLEQKHGIRIPFEHGILDRTEPPKPEEMEDCFPKNAGPVAVSRKDTDAWRMQEATREEDFHHMTCLQLPVQETLAAAHKYKATMTVFLSALMMQALANAQKDMVPEGKTRERIKLLIPINLRNLFPSSTLRNFAMYTVPELDPRLGEYTLEEIIKIVQAKMALEFTPKYMSGVIATNVRDEENPFLRIVPLPIKNMVMRAVFNSVGEKKSCLSFSNLGQVKVPEIMAGYIRRFDFILGVQATAPYNCGMLSYEDTIYINFIRNIREPALERHFYQLLQQQGLPVTVESNQRRDT